MKVVSPPPSLLEHVNRLLHFIAVTSPLSTSAQKRHVHPQGDTCITVKCNYCWQFDTKAVWIYIISYVCVVNATRPTSRTRVRWYSDRKRQQRSHVLEPNTDRQCSVHQLHWHFHTILNSIINRWRSYTSITQQYIFPHTAIRTVHSTWSLTCNCDGRFVLRCIHSTATACKHHINQLCDMTWTSTLI